MIKKIVYWILFIFISYISILFIASRFAVPSNDRDWESGFSPLPTVVINGDTVTINNVRDYRYNESETLSWNTKSVTVNVNDIERVWYLISKPSKNNTGGHVFYTFDFRNSDPLVLSIEARREKGEPFNGVKGVFRGYEIMYMWGTEKDFLVMRPVLYKKWVNMYPLKIGNEEAKVLFLDLVETTHSLETTPVWYNSLVHNCANTFYQHVNDLAPGTVPFKITQWLVGDSDKTLFNLGYFNINSANIDEARDEYAVSEFTMEHYNDENFPQELREYLLNE